MQNKAAALPMPTGMQILKSFDYAIFKAIKGNRAVNELHVLRLIKSFKTKYLVSPILVNSKLEVVDGAHRLEACKRLGLPVYYVVVPYNGLEDIHLLNTYNLNWKVSDYLDAYCALGKPEYLKVREFRNQYPDFSIKSAMVILTQLVRGREEGFLVHGNVKKADHTGKSFESGTFKVRDLAASYNIAAMLSDFKQFYNGYSRSIFVGTMLQLFKSDKYNHEEMIAKLHLQPTALTNCVNAIQYREVLEDIYNYKRREKVSFKFI